MSAAAFPVEALAPIEPRPDHAQYLNNWLKVLRNDSGAILKAATLAKKAAAFLSKSSETEEEDQAEAA